MGVSKSPLAFAEKCLVAQKAMETAAKTSVETTALAVKKSITEISPARLRGVGKRGAKLSVRYNLDNYPDGRKALVYALGPWQLIEGDTKAHRVPKQRSSRARRRVVVIPGVGVRAYANHPGTKGKHLFAKGAVAGLLVGREITKRETSAAIHSIF